MQIELNRAIEQADWLKEKILLDALSANAARRVIKRGQVYFCKFGRNIGSEQEKTRPCVIIQNDSSNRTSPNTVVAPITHTHSTLDCVVPIANKIDGSGEIVLDGCVLVGNIVTISKGRLDKYIIDLTPKEMKRIDNAMFGVLGLGYVLKHKENIIADKEKYIQALKRKIDKLKSQ